MRNKIVVLVALMALAGFAAASAITVKQRQDTASLHAERYTIGTTFNIEASEVAPVLSTESAIGTIGTPMEISTAVPLARTLLTRDDWMYTVTVKEVTSGSAGLSGVPLVVELQVDGLPRGQVFLNQSIAESSGFEGARVSFALGTTIDSSSLYYIVVKPYAPTGPPVDVTLHSNSNGNNTWLGVGGGINNVVNPDLALTFGSVLRITAKNNEAAPALHNIGVKQTAGSSTPLSPGWSVDLAAGESTLLAWSAPSAGTYVYACKYHPGMTGKIVVT